MPRAFSLASTNGKLTHRARLWWKIRQGGSTIRLPFRLPSTRVKNPVGRVQVGKNTYIAARMWLMMSDSRAHIEIGDDCLVGESVTFSCGQRIVIGSGTGIGERTTIVDQHHDPESWIRPALEAGTTPIMGSVMAEPEPVHVGNGCWIGVNVVIMPGVTIGDGCVIGANSVVTSDIPPYSMAVGVPAKVIRSYQETLT